jgi:hypothetical protein
MTAGPSRARAGALWVQIGAGAALLLPAAFFAATIASGGPGTAVAALRIWLFVLAAGAGNVAGAIGVRRGRTAVWAALAAVVGMGAALPVWALIARLTRSLAAGLVYLAAVEGALVGTLILLALPGRRSRGGYPSSRDA